jgi:hypothetical protein
MLFAVNPGRQSRLFSEVNDRIYDLLEGGDPDLTGEFLCECGCDCGRRVVLLPGEFVELRLSGRTVRSPDCPGSRLFRRGRGSRPADGVPALR